MRCNFIFCCLALCQIGFAETPINALKRLKQGNLRYVNDRSLYCDHSADRRSELTHSQNPFAIILGCSDSRVPPEIIFDQGLGDLFIIRVAGNVLGATELDSIDFAAKYLGASLIVVMGHASCGAVSAVMKGQTADIANIAALIKPSIEGAYTLEEAIKANVRGAVNALKQNSFINALIKAKKIDCVGAYYDLGSGKVEILDRD